MIEKNRAVRIASALIVFLFVVAATAQVRRPLSVPDIPGYRTLKGDFHIHTVFSDGLVWPTVRVHEAWRDGLDVISLNDHVEYHPHKEDVKVDGTRSYAIGKPVADAVGIILIPGVEITKTLPHGPAHFNALFVKDANALFSEDFHEALRLARKQDAFVFWNHPEWRVPKAEWFPPIAAAHAEKLFQGMELVNGPNFYAGAYPLIEQKNLTIIATSDAHQPVPPRESGGIRPVTLIFARTANEAGVREALFARRTAAWMGDEVWGNEEQLRALWEAAVKFENAELQPRRGAPLYLRVSNNSAIPFRFRVRQAPAWFRTEANLIAAEGTSLIDIGLGREAPIDAARFELELDLLNVHPGPSRNLTVRVPLRLGRR